MRKRQIFFGGVFTAVVALDAAVFLSTHSVMVINWRNPVHYGWVLGAAAMFWLAIALRSRIFFQALFCVYGAVFGLSLLNQYAHITPVLTSHCMLLNAMLATFYLFAI